MTILDVEPPVRLFNRDEYFKMADIGLFNDQRVELIAGQILRMPPHNNPHAVAIMIITEWLVSNLRGRYGLRCQLSLAVNKKTVPEPDFAVIKGTAETLKQHPKTALLVVEVSHTTLRHDRKKVDIYASAGVPEYWLLNLRKRELEVYRRPERAEESPFGAKYAEMKTYAADETVKVKGLPLPAVKVQDLMGTVI